MTTLRARLSLWNALAFAVLLGGFAAGTYAFVVSTTQRRTDAYLAQTATAVAQALVGAEATGADPLPTTAAVAAAIGKFRYRDIGVGVFDVTPASAGAPAAAPRPVAVTRADAVTYPFGGPWGVAGVLPLVARAVREGTVTATLGEGPSAERVVATTLPAGERVLVVSATQSLGDQQVVLRQAREALVAGVLFTLVVASVGGYAVTWWSLRPIAVMSRRAARIEAGTLHERLPVRAEIDELARLATAFNGLLERLQRTFDEQRQFLADASHELRTPVAIVRGEAEYALAQPARAEAEYRAAFGTVRAQSEVLARLVDDLFLLARANAGEQAIAREPLYLEELCEACVRAVRTLAAARGVRVAFVPDAELPVAGDERLLRRLVMNLLDNAIKYTPAGGEVRVRVEHGAPAPAEADADGAPDAPPDAPTDASPDGGIRHVLAERWTGEYRAVEAPRTVAHVDGSHDGRALAAAGTRPRGPRARLVVEDTGPGIPPDAQAHVFERFYRARHAAAPAGNPGDSSGAGLGLAIAAWVASAHGGRVALVRSDASGTAFAVELPLLAPAADDAPGGDGSSAATPEDAAAVRT